MGVLRKEIAIDQLALRMWSTLQRTSIAVSSKTQEHVVKIENDLTHRVHPMSAKNHLVVTYG